MDRAEGALIVAEKALGEANKANARLSDSTVNARLDGIERRLASLDGLAARIDGLSEVIIQFSNLAARLSAVESRPLPRDGIDPARLDHFASRIDGIADALTALSGDIVPRVSILESHPAPHDGKDVDPATMARIEGAVSGLMHRISAIEATRFAQANPGKRSVKHERDPITNRVIRSIVEDC